MQEPVTAFRSSFWTTFAVILVWSVPLALGVIVVLVIRSEGWGRVNWFALLLACGVAVVGIFVLDLVGTVLVILFRVFVSPEGIRCYDFWGRYHTVTWPDVVDVRPINMLGLKYLRVYAEDVSTPVWVPTFLTDQRGFDDLVRQYAGPGHLFTRAIDRFKEEQAGQL